MTKKTQADELLAALYHLRRAYRALERAGHAQGAELGQLVGKATVAVRTEYRKEKDA